MKAAIAGRLQGDATLTALLTGGVYTRLVKQGMAAPTPFDSVGRIKPCVAVRMETAAGAHVKAKARQVFVSLFFYDWQESDVLEQARARARLLLNGWRPGSEGSYLMRHVSDQLDLFDDELSAHTAISRYVVPELV